MVRGLRNDHRRALLFALVKLDQLPGDIVIGDEGVTNMSQAGVAVLSRRPHGLLHVEGRHLSAGSHPEDVGRVAADDVRVTVIGRLRVRVAAVQSLTGHGEIGLTKQLLDVEVHSEEIIGAGDVVAARGKGITVIDENLQEIGVGSQDKSADVQIVLNGHRDG